MSLPPFTGMLEFVQIQDHLDHFLQRLILYFFKNFCILLFPVLPILLIERSNFGHYLHLFDSISSIGTHP